MTNEETIFAEALGKGSPAERSAYLDQACAGNVQLREAVDELLLAHEGAGGILEVPPAGLEMTRPSSPSSESVGSTIGPYKLLEQIGGGGMGVVFMAEQLRPVRRKVALKIIKPGMDSGQVIARFEAERQALAMMDHTNIAKVFDAGTTDAGRPYFVMELVKGIPITDYCDQARLTTRQRLELFIPVCQAVQHAHQKGVIHRDLKPSNVLVTLHDDKPVPKVIDFGIAKATGQQLTERTLFTNYAQMVGTPLYMSPEQAQISGTDVDTRSDVYSLGVLLYELLTGTTPFDKQRLREAAYDEMRRIIREEEPPNPSTRLSTMGDKIASISAQRHTEPKKLSQIVHGELDWIAMKALEKDRTRRYETAIGLARDVERYLRDEAVQACPPSASYRFRKFARRNKAALAVATAALATLLLLVLGLAVSNRLIAAERNEKAKALTEKEQALALAEAQRARSDANFLKAIVAVRDIITGTALGHDNIPLPLRRKFSDQAIKFYESLVQEGSPDASLLYDTAVGYRTIGMLHKSWREFEQAEKCFQNAITILDRLSSEHPAVQQYRNQLGYAHLELSRTLYQAGRFQEAEPVATSGIRLYEKLLAQTPDSSDYIGQLANFYIDAIKYNVRAASQQGNDPYRAAFELLERAANLPDTPPPTGVVHSQHTVAHRQRDLAFILRGVRRLDEAEQMFRYAVRTFERLRNNAPGNAPYWHFLADTHLEVGRVLLDRKKPEEAEQEFRQAIEIHEKRVAMKLPDDRVHHLGWSVAYLDLAQLLINTGRTDEAVPLVTRSVEVHPTNDGQPVKLKALTKLGNLFREAGDFGRALATYSQVIEAKPPVADAWIGRGHCYLDKGELDKAAKDFSAVIELYQKRPADSVLPPGELATLGNVCRKFASDGRERSPHASELALKAVPLYHAAMAEYEKLASIPDRFQDCWQFAIAYEQVATALKMTNQVREAERAWRDPQRIWLKLVTATDSQDHRWHLAINYENVGHVLKQSGRLDECVQGYQQALAIWEKLAAETGAEDHRNHLAWTRQSLVEVLRSQNKTAEAEAVLQKVETEFRETIRQQPDSAELRKRFAELLQSRGKGAEAVAMYGEVIRLRPESAEAWAGRGEIYSKQGEHEKSEADFAKAIELEPGRWENWHLRAFSHFHRQQWEQAIADFSKAAELDPKVHTNWYHRGHAHLALAQWDKAAADFTKVLEGWPLDVWAMYHRATASAQLHRHDEAIADLRNAIAQGFGDGTKMAINGLKTDARFEPVRAIDEFKKLIASLEATLTASSANEGSRLTEALARDPANPMLGMQLGDFLRDAGDMDGAWARYAEAIARRTPEAMTSELQANLAERVSQLARVFRDKQKFEQAERAYRQAISVREPLGRDAAPALRLAQASDYNDLAFTLVYAKRLADAEVAEHASLELKHALVNQFPQNPDYRMHLAHSYLGLGHIARDARKTTDCTQAYGQADDILNKLAAEKPEAEGLRSWLGHTFWDLGDAWMRVERVHDAEKANQQALKMYAELAAAYPANRFYRQEQGFSLRKLADVAQRAARIEDAQRHLQDALRFYRELAATETSTSSFYLGETAQTAKALAEVHAQLGQWAEAVIDLNEAAKASDLAGRYQIWSRLALVRLAMKDEAGYRETCGKLMAELPANNSNASHAFRTAWSSILLPNAGVDVAQVVRVAQQAIAVNPKDPDYLLAFGAALYRAGRFEDAAKTLADADDAYRRESSSPTPGIHVTTTPVYSDLFLAMTHQRLGQHDEAARWLKHATQTVDQIPPTTQSAAGSWSRKLTLQILRKEVEAMAAQPAR